MTLGEPAGIGPDLALTVWHRRAELKLPPFYIVADAEFLRRRAARLVDLLEERGVIGPADGAKPRSVIGQEGTPDEVDHATDTPASETH